MSRRRSQLSPMGKNFGRGPLDGPPPEKPKNFRKTGKRLLGYLYPYRLLLISVSILAIFSSIFGVISPRIMGLATTRIFEGYLEITAGIPGASLDFSYIGRIVLVLTVVYLLSAGFTYIMQYVLAGLSQRIIYTIREQMSTKLKRLPVRFYDNKSQGDLLSRVVNDVDTIGGTLQQSITQFMTSIISIIGVIVMMLIISPLLSVIVLSTLVLSVIGAKMIVTRSQGYYKDQQSYLGELNGHTEEMYTGHKIVKAYGYEDASLERFKELNQSLYDAGWKANFLSGLIMPLMGFINNLGYVFIAAYGAIMISQGRIPIGDVQAFIQYTRQLSHPIVQAANISNIIQSTVAAAERIFEFLDEEEESKEQETKSMSQKKGRIEFNHLTFGYSPDQPVIRDFSLTVEEGQTVAIVGATGSGKTTLVNLLMKYYPVTKGQILIDDVDINRISRYEVRKYFGMVLQDTWLFQGSIFDNIRYGNKEASEKEVYEAATMANLDVFVPCLPDGYETEINEDGNNISKGQKQLITIARAFITNPRILILDEATSNVDTRTEIMIQKATRKLMEGRTNIIIAHRISTIKEADLIIVMDQGRIIEKGTHQALLLKKGHYYELYTSQFTVLAG